MAKPKQRKVKEAKEALAMAQSHLAHKQMSLAKVGTQTDEPDKVGTQTNTMIVYIYTLLKIIKSSSVQKHDAHRKIHRQLNCSLNVCDMTMNMPPLI